MTEDRIARLERIAYGADTSDEERADAARELMELRAASRSHDDDDDASDTDSGAGASALADVAVASEAPDATPTPVADPRRRTRRLIVVSTAALVIGVLSGWQLGAREAEQQADLAAAADAAFPGPRTQAEYIESLPVAADSPAAAVFDRPAAPEDVPVVPWSPDPLAMPPETRLLAMRADGVGMYAARDGAEFCLLAVSVPALTASSTCTDDGRFPEDGLGLGFSVTGAPEQTVDLRWHPDGTVTMLVPGRP